ncbi:MAG TPA: hypothetical protein VGD81_19630 [Opitutaceae bacterium]
MTHSLSEKKESLWPLVIAPAIWAAHLLLSYVTAAIWCAKAPSRDHPLGPVRGAIVGYTVIALVGIGLAGWRGLRGHRLGTESPPHDYDTPGDRHGFLGYATVLLAALSAIATVFAAFVVLFFEDCR